MRNAMLIIGLLIGGVLAGVMLVDEGELVTLRTQGPDGAHYDTQLWVIEREGEFYLRAHFPGAKWLTRLRNHPKVEVRRGDASESFLALPADDPEVRRAINQAMAVKGTATFRHDNLVYLSTDIKNLAEQSHVKVWGGLKLEYIYDNSRRLGTNLYSGTRLKVFGEAYFGLVSGVLTFLILIFSEIIPKTIGAKYWKGLSLASGVIINIMIIATYPLVVLLSFISNIFASPRG